jgi:hypothetical protein
VFGAGVEHGELSPATLAWDLEEDLIAGLGDVERTPGGGCNLAIGHGRSISGVRLGTPSL